MTKSAGQCIQRFCPGALPLENNTAAQTELMPMV